MLSGNRNFEGRINPDVKMNYLASPPLVVAYALAGDDGLRHRRAAARQDEDGKEVYLKDIWPSQKDVAHTIATAISSEMFRKSYADVFKGDERWQQAAHAERRALCVGPGFDLRAQAAVLRRACRPSRSR